MEILERIVQIAGVLGFTVAGMTLCGFIMYLTFKDIKDIRNTGTGEWTRKRTIQHDGELYCKQCGHEALLDHSNKEVPSNFCPNCGKKMRSNRS